MTDPLAVIQSLSNAPEFLHLRKEVLEIPGSEIPSRPARNILVIEQCGLTTARRARIDREIKSNPLNLEFIDPLEEFGASRLYVDIASVSFGDVPTLTEFLAMPPAESGVWVDMVYKVNPSLLSWVSELQTVIEETDAELFKSLGVAVNKDAGEDKKKARKRRK